MKSYCLLGKVRLGAARLGYNSGKLLCQIGKRFTPAYLGRSRLGTFRLGQTAVITNFREPARGSLSIDDAGKSEIPTCSFTIKSDLAHRPYCGQPVIIAIGTLANPLFNGVLMNPQETKVSHNLYEYSCSAEGFARILKKRIINTTYTNQKAGAIVKTILTQYLYGAYWNEATIEDGCLIESYQADFKTALDVINELAERSGCIFYIDATKTAHFQTLTSVAPWHLTGTTQYTDLSISEDNDNVITTLYLRYTQLELMTETFKGDGEKEEFTLAEKPASVTAILVNDVAQTFDERYQTDNSQNDFSVSIDQKYVKNSKHAVLTADDILSVTYNAAIMTRLKVVHQAAKDALMIQAGGDGVAEHVITNRDITTYHEALEYAVQELTRLCTPQISANYTRIESVTNYFQARLRVGMQQAVMVRNRNHLLQIDSISTTIFVPTSSTPLSFQLQVSLSKQKSLTELIKQVYDTANTEPLVMEREDTIVIA